MQRLSGAVVTVMAALAWAGSLAPCGAQVVRGRVVDASTGEPVAAAEVRLAGTGGEAGHSLSGLTGELGLFTIEVGRQGLFELTVHRIGYDSTAVQRLLVSGDLTYLDIRLAPVAVALAPLTVVARAEVPFLEDRGFYHRQRTGLGTFLTPEDIARRPALETSELFRRVAGLVITRGQVRLARGAGLGRPCPLRVMLDGVRFNGDIDTIPVQAIDAIEVYKGPATTPPQWRDTSGCGALVIWTKH